MAADDPRASHARRWRPDEDDWAAWVQASGAEPAGAVVPLPGTAPSDAVPTDLAADAIRLVAAGAVQVQVASSRTGGPALIARLGSDGRSAGGAVRRVAPRASGGDDPREAALDLLPGVELSLTWAAALAEEALRLLPPAPGWGEEADPVQVAPEIADAAVTHARRGDDARLAALCRLAGWDDLPPVLGSLRRLQGEATIVVAAPGRPAQALRLLLGTRGWVELGLAAPTDVVHTPVDHGALLRRLAAALAPALVDAAGGPR
ncbi:hypothetical protein K8Z61_10740 [Nocardioides sp. TRM66260-LWL]|uniref:hypothetical protein n=1 Tax=Nocardioides sp. TRM66260-LWL TaxID=2874478 RepID=UPI001CC7D8EB|nr:hypothetical protein [Nocardioides sp. TRM66260-LWL]MBZ5734974.1 hypothetical protein [Nocardioides sp. TRM66260-LWL]